MNNAVNSNRTRAQALNLALTSVFVSEIFREIQNLVSSKHFYHMLLNEIKHLYLNYKTCNESWKYAGFITYEK